MAGPVGGGGLFSQQCPQFIDTDPASFYVHGTMNEAMANGTQQREVLQSGACTWRCLREGQDVMGLESCQCQRPGGCLGAISAAVAGQPSRRLPLVQ